jgi:hypothetical protein
MKYIPFSQLDFSSVLFDSLFGLILFFSFDSFLDVAGVPNFILYVFSIVILVHWWLLFKSVDDILKTEVTNSVVDIIFGIVDIILLVFITIYSKYFNMPNVILFTAALFLVDLLWGVLWKYVGKWKTKDKVQIRKMEKELTNTIISDAIGIGSFLLLYALIPYLPINLILAVFIFFYGAYIVLTFKKNLIDIKFF